MQVTEFMEPNKKIKDIELKKEIRGVSMKMIKFKDEFKKFISKGNVIDLAVAVVIGNAFNKITSSLVDDIIMPLVGMLIGGVNFTELQFKVGDAIFSYGRFIQNVVDFIIIAFTIFIFIKVFAKLTGKKEEEKKDSPKKNDEVKLLEEIRDLLKK